MKLKKKKWFAVFQFSSDIFYYISYTIIIIYHIIQYDNSGITAGGFSCLPCTWKNKGNVFTPERRSSTSATYSKCRIRTVHQDPSGGTVRRHVLRSIFGAGPSLCGRYNILLYYIHTPCAIDPLRHGAHGYCAAWMLQQARREENRKLCSKKTIFEPRPFGAKRSASHVLTCRERNIYRQDYMVKVFFLKNKFEICV